jgi:hypothetical protein
MQFKGIRSVIAAAALGIVATASQATIATVFDAVPAGTAAFQQTVSATGATAHSDRLVGLSGGTSISRGDYTISKPTGNALWTTTYGNLTGDVVSIDPSGSGSDPLGYRASGIRFSFNTAVNAIGFEVGDWGTCCQPSALYISFDGGAPIRVGLSEQYGDVFYNGLSEVFVAAFDDSGAFSTVDFWGDGVGEVLVAGGTIRYALLDEGSLEVPEPGTAALVGLAGAGLIAWRRRRSATH